MDARDGRSGSHDICNFTRQMKLHLLLRSSCCLIMKVGRRLKCHLKRIRVCIMQGLMIFALLHSHFTKNWISYVDTFTSPLSFCQCGGKKILDHIAAERID